jgi:hypothetical protein
MLSEQLGYTFKPHVTTTDDLAGRWTTGDVIVTAQPIQ